MISPTSSLSPDAPAFRPSQRREGQFPSQTSEPQAAQPTEPPKPPYHWRMISPHTRLVYIRDPRIADYEISRLRPGPLGFDLEWKPAYRKGQRPNLVALVQLANADTILLIHISQMSGTRIVSGYYVRDFEKYTDFPVLLKDILEKKRSYWHPLFVEFIFCCSRSGQWQREL